MNLAPEIQSISVCGGERREEGRKEEREGWRDGETEDDAKQEN